MDTDKRKSKKEGHPRGVSDLKRLLGGRFAAVAYRYHEMKIFAYDDKERAINFLKQGGYYGDHAEIMVYDLEQDKPVWINDFYRSVVEKETKGMKEQIARRST